MIFMDKLGVAVIGAGRMGLRRASALSKNPQSELVCIVDPYADLSEISANLGCDFSDNYLEVITRHDVDAVIVSVPNNLHYEMTINSIKQNKHVFCEKPLAINSKEAELMVESSITHDVFIKTGANVRFFKNVLKLKQLLEDGVIGALLFSRGWIGHAGWNLNKKSWFSDSAQSGGGTLLDNGCHLIDLIRWFCGEIIECQGYNTTRLHKLDGLEDNSFSLLISNSGVPSFFQSSWTEWNGYLYLELYGTSGVLILDNRGDSEKIIHKNVNNQVEDILDFSKYPKTSFNDEVDHFIKSIRVGIQPQPSGYDGMRAVQIIERLYESSNKGLRLSTFDEEHLKKYQN